MLRDAGHAVEPLRGYVTGVLGKWVTVPTHWHSACLSCPIKLLPVPHGSWDLERWPAWVRRQRHCRSRRTWGPWRTQREAAHIDQLPPRFWETPWECTGERSPPSPPSPPSLTRGHLPDLVGFEFLVFSQPGFETRLELPDCFLCHLLLHPARHVMLMQAS